MKRTGLLRSAGGWPLDAGMASRHPPPKAPGASGSVRMVLFRCREDVGAPTPLGPHLGEDGLLPAQLMGERDTRGAMATFVRHREQSHCAGTLVVPSGVVDDRIEADPLDRHARLDAAAHLLA